MRGEWLHRGGSSSCLIFFAGWGMDPHPFRPLVTGRQDIHMVWDYRQVEEFDLRPFHAYSRLHLLAWSMGVYVSCLLLSDNTDLLHSAVAVNGTPTPIHDRLGIPVAAYEEMSGNLNREMVLDFYRDMFPEAGAEREMFMSRPPRRSLESLRTELLALSRLYQHRGPGRDIFTRHIVGSRDTVFPARNQLRCWQRERCRVIRAGHLPFFSPALPEGMDPFMPDSWQ